MTHALGRLLRQNVAAMRLVPLELAGRGFLEPLGGTTIGFQFGHNNVPLQIKSKSLDLGVSKGE